MTSMRKRSRYAWLALLLVLAMTMVCGVRRTRVGIAEAPQMPLPRSLQGTIVEVDSPRPQDLPEAGPWVVALDRGSWYRYQGEPNSGPYAHSNCGPTCVAMAIQFTQDGRRVPIRDIRSHIGGTSWTYPSHLQSALRHWDVPHVRLNSMQEIHDAVALRGSIVIVHLWMHWFTRGADYLVAYSDPSQHHGRYYAYAQSHWVVFHGMTEDGEWAICHDPNVWEGDGRYWYAGNRPKGENRYYRYTELAGSAADYGFQAIEVFAPVLPSATPSPLPSPTPRKRVDLPLVYRPAPSTPTQTPSPSPSETMQPTSAPSTIPASPTAATLTATPSATLAPTLPSPTATETASSQALLTLSGRVRVWGTDDGISGATLRLSTVGGSLSPILESMTASDGTFVLSTTVDLGDYHLTCELPVGYSPFSLSLPPSPALSAIDISTVHVQVDRDLILSPFVFSAMQLDLASVVASRRMLGDAHPVR